MLHIFDYRIRAFLDNQISQEQASFVKTREQILNLRQIIEKDNQY